MTASPVEVSRAVEAYRRAWEWVKLVWCEAKFTTCVDDLKLVDYDDGVFTFETSTQAAVDLLSRNSERHTLQNAIAVYMPADIRVQVVILPDSGVQHG